MAMSCNSSSSSVFGSSPIMTAIPAVSKPGNEPCFVSRLGGSQKKLRGLKTRTVSYGSRKRACAIRAAKSGSVDASTDTSRGPAEVQSHLALLERMTENSTASPGHAEKLGDVAMPILVWGIPCETDRALCIVLHLARANHGPGHDIYGRLRRGNWSRCPKNNLCCHELGHPSSHCFPKGRWPIWGSGSPGVDLRLLYPQRIVRRSTCS